MSGLGVWLAKGDRIGFLRFVAWVFGGIVSLVVILVVHQYLAHGREYLSRNSPNTHWSAIATEGPWTYRVWIRRRYREYAPMDQVWRSHGAKPIDLVWESDDALVVVLPRGSRKAGIWLGKRDHRFLDLEGKHQDSTLQYSSERIDIVTVVESDDVLRP